MDQVSANSNLQKEQAEENMSSCFCSSLTGSIISSFVLQGAVGELNFTWFQISWLSQYQQCSSEMG